MNRLDFILKTAAALVGGAAATRLDGAALIPDAKYILREDRVGRRRYACSESSTVRLLCPLDGDGVDADGLIADVMGAAPFDGTPPVNGMVVVAADGRAGGMRMSDRTWVPEGSDGMHAAVARGLGAWWTVGHAGGMADDMLFHPIDPPEAQGERCVVRYSTGLMPGWYFGRLNEGLRRYHYHATKLVRLDWGAAITVEPNRVRTHRTGDPLSYLYRTAEDTDTSFAANLARRVDAERPAFAELGHDAYTFKG